MRLVAIADTHTFENELATIPDGDVFILAGDLLRRGTLDELEEVAQWIRGLPHRYKLVIAGNHDFCFVNYPDIAAQILGPNVLYMQDQATVINGIRFWGSPWQPEYFDWAFNLPRGAALASKWALIPDGTHVLITHGPPEGFGDKSPSGERAGCADLLTAVRRIRPMLHIFGHIHQDGGFWRENEVCFANVTTWECERAATVIDIDPINMCIQEIIVPPALVASIRPHKVI